MPHIETAIARVPAFGEVGVKEVYNGAIAYTPDGSPIIGPAWDLKNFWLNEGHSFGVTAAGGAGWQLAEWIVEGEPTIDMMGVDPRRFGPYASRGYLRRKNEEAYRNVFTPHFPDEERAAARPLKQTPCYDRMKRSAPVFGSVYGWERPNWFAPTAMKCRPEELNVDDVLTNHNHAPPTIPARCASAGHSAAPTISSMSATNAATCTRRSACSTCRPSPSALCRARAPRTGWKALFANRIPKKVGRVGLCHMLNAAGGVRAEFTVYKTARRTTTWSRPALSSVTTTTICKTSAWRWQRHRCQ